MANLAIDRLSFNRKISEDSRLESERILNKKLIDN